MFNSFRTKLKARSLRREKKLLLRAISIYSIAIMRVYTKEDRTRLVRFYYKHAEQKRLGLADHLSVPVDLEPLHQVVDRAYKYTKRVTEIDEELAFYEIVAHA